MLGGVLLYYSIQSYTLNQLVNAKCQYTLFKLSKNQVVILRVNSQFELKINNEIFNLQQGDIVYCGNAVLYNPNVFLASIEVLIFNTNFMHKQVHIMKGDDVNYEILSSIFQSVRKVKYSKELEELNLKISKILMNLFEIQFNDSRKINADIIDPRLIIINRFIRKNYHKPLTLESLAELVDSNPIYLSNTYSKVIAISPMKHIQVLRMKKAEELLRTTKLRIFDISSQLGYISVSQFITIYKKYYNLSPSKYRKYILSYNKSVS